MSECAHAHTSWYPATFTVDDPGNVEAEFCHDCGKNLGFRSLGGAANRDLDVSPNTLVASLRGDYEIAVRQAAEATDRVDALARERDQLLYARRILHEKYECLEGERNDLLERSIRSEVALWAVHEYQCGCDSPGYLGRCTAQPVVVFALLDSASRERVNEKGAPEGTPSTTDEAESV